MVTLTVRNLPDEVHRALRVRAAKHGRSTEAEVRAILEESTQPEGRVRLGSILSSIGQTSNLTNKEFASFAKRETTPGQPINLE